MKLCALVLIACLSLVSGAAAVSWQRPVAGSVLRSFQVGPDRYARGQHRGVDLSAALGARVGAACGGRVRFAGSVPGGGRTVSVACGPLVATYQHLGAVAVRRGEVVAPGGAVGTVGRSGRPRGTGPHVHLGARVAASGRYVDPLTLFGPAGRLLPPVGAAPRRRVPLGPAPRAALRRPVRLRVPVALAPAGDRRAAPAPAPGVPLAVWGGLAACGLGLPLGGLVRRRRRRRGGATAAARGRRWAAAHR